MAPYSVRDAAADEQRELTQLFVCATMQTGYDQAFIDRAIPGLMITVPLIAGGCVQVAHRGSEVVGVVTVTTTMLQGVALLHVLYVDPVHWKRGVGRALFQAAVIRAKVLKAGALLIYAEPSAEGFYQRMGAARISQGTFYYSPEIVLPLLLYILPPDNASDARRVSLPVAAQILRSF